MLKTTLQETECWSELKCGVVLKCGKLGKLKVTEFHLVKICCLQMCEGAEGMSFAAVKKV